MTCLGKWLLASCALHLLAATGMALLVTTTQKPVAVIDLSQLGHSSWEPAAEQAGGNAQQEQVPRVPVQHPAADQPKPRKLKRVAQERPSTKCLKSAAQTAAAADASEDNAPATATGGQAASGQAGSGPGGPAGNGGGQGGAYRGVYFGYITKLVQKAEVYPLQARRMGWQGTVTVSFVIRTDGSIADADVLKSSGHAALDASALAAVKKLAPLPSPGQPVEINLPVFYRLTGP